MHPGQKLKPGAVVRFEGEAGVLMGEVLERRFQGRRTIRLWPEAGGDVLALIESLGHVPLPPYIRREDTADDRERYQTVFARVRGSVAAPTAGLHFTQELLDELTGRGVERADITLHVGYGTFKPITADRVEDHEVDGEHYTIGDAAAVAINRARAEGRRVIAVGTTTTRALEDAAMRGSGVVRPGTATAEIFIYPGFEFQRDRRAPHELPPAEVVFADARVRLRRPRARPAGVCDRGRGAIPVLQLRGCDAGM